MPRLLLVDDNPSIHKIAETLLAATDVELVCLESGEEALRRIAAGERFDVALLDIAMAGLDGWGLLEQLRSNPVTARIPIAMMAGVLDTVDPVRIQQAPIQGFLKKPVELRELGDRVHKLLETPVPAPASAVDTIPAMALDELVPDAADLLVLGPEDLLFPEEGLAPAGVDIAAEASLELEELDLETLHGLQEPGDEPQPASGALEPLEDYLEPLEASADLSPADAWADEAWDKALSPVVEAARTAEEIPFLVTSDELPDLGDLVAAAEAPTIALEAPPQLLEAPALEVDLSLEEELDLGSPLLQPSPMDGFSLVLPVAGAGLAAAGAAALVHSGSQAAAVPPVLPVPADPAESRLPPALPSAPVTLTDSVPAHPLVAALLSDPEALAALAKAVAAHLSDRTLKEIAWEVMPELAERLQR
jgi:CheY-like chemotaxis protein